ncbi:MAG: hypothetical protein AAGA30_17575 [Planctomycetota bacterium]
MNGFHVLMTGDYWHRDFFNVISKSPVSITLKTLDSLSNAPQNNNRFDAVVVALSRRDRYSAVQLESLVHQFVNTPVIALCGSWCEGEMRSGDPVPGMIRVYWHQWAGRLDSYLEQLKTNVPHSWLLPKIANEADRVSVDSSTPIKLELSESTIGISATSEEGYQLLRTALDDRQRHSFWIEQEDSVSRHALAAICIEANSFDEAVKNRVRELRFSYPSTPVVLVMNFPRRADFEKAAEFGIHDIVSKPFQLKDLQFAIWRSVNGAAA